MYRQLNGHSLGASCTPDRGEHRGRGDAGQVCPQGAVVPEMSAETSHRENATRGGVEGAGEGVREEMPDVSSEGDKEPLR